jgi:hypothetical protein
MPLRSRVEIDQDEVGRSLHHAARFRRSGESLPRRTARRVIDTLRRRYPADPKTWRKSRDRSPPGILPESAHRLIIWLSAFGGSTTWVFELPRQFWPHASGMAVAAAVAATGMTRTEITLTLSAG